MFHFRVEKTLFLGEMASKKKQIDVARERKMFRLRDARGTPKMGRIPGAEKRISEVSYGLAIQ